MDKTEQDRLKKEVAEKAADMVKSGMILGVGTGSTVAFFIDALGKRSLEWHLGVREESVGIVRAPLGGFALRVGGIVFDVAVEFVVARGAACLHGG